MTLDVKIVSVSNQRIQSLHLPRGKKITKTIGGYSVLYVEVFEACGTKHSCFEMVMLTGEKQSLSQSLLTPFKMCQALV